MGAVSKEQIFTETFNALHFRLTRFCHGRLEEADAVDEVVQITFMKAWAHIDQFRAEAEFSTWIYKIAVNECFQWKRNGDRRLKGLLSLDGIEKIDSLVRQLAYAPSQLKQYEQNELKGRLLVLIERLPQIFRTVINLHMEDKSNAEIAAILGISVPAVKTRYHRAILRLRDALLRSMSRPSIQR